MAIKLSDLRKDSWLVIVGKIKKGGCPEITDLAAALRRGETLIPTEAQEYIADLLDGTKRRARGRPLLVENPDFLVRQMLADNYIIYRVERWRRVMKERYGVRNPLEAAIARVAKAPPEQEPDTVRKRYYAACRRIRPPRNVVIK